MSSVAVITTEIPANQSLSGAVDLGAGSILAIKLPDNFPTTTLTFQSKAEFSEHNINNANLIEQDWDNVYDDAGTEISVTVAANRIVVVGTATKNLGACRYLRVRCGTAAAPLNVNPTMLIRFIIKQP